MKRHLFLLAIATAVTTLSFASRPAFAQPAAALGKPLPDGTLPAGTISVRIVAGAPSSPVIGTDVTLVVNGQPRVARTDSQGRAMFPEVARGAAVVAKVTADGNEQSSEQFQVPMAGGVRVMLSTKPFPGSTAMPAAPGGGHGMPEARQMSGQPRLDREVPAGTYQVRLTYNNLEIKDGKSVDAEPPLGEAVTLVGYNADYTVDVRSAKVDAKGHAVFEDLDVGGNIVYYAMARLPRAGGFDRLSAGAASFGGQVGAKLILSGDKRTATTPPIDELSGPQGSATEAGKVRVVLDGIPNALSEVTLVDAASRSIVARGTPKVIPPDPTKIEGGARFEPLADLPAGTLAIFVHGGEGGTDQPMPEIALRVVPVDDPTAEGLASKTGHDGTVRLAVAPDKQHKVVFTVRGQNLWSDPVDLSKTGGKLDFVVRWEGQGRPAVVLDVPYNSAHVLYAETTQKDQLTGKDQIYRSVPFQPIETTGTTISIPVLPRVMFRFSWQSFVEDELLAVRGLFSIDNNSYVPYRAGPDGLLIPLPRDHKGGVVGERYQDVVSVAAGEGLRILRPIPPGRMQFEAGFSLKGDEGVVDWSLDLPLGTFQSALQIRETAQLRVKLPSGVQGDTRTASSGQKYFVIEDIMIKPGQSMAMRISGLPRHAPWKKWVPRFVGILVLATMIAGLVFAIYRKGGGSSDQAARRTALMAELVELEKTGKDPKRKDEVLAELEKLWPESTERA